MLQAGKENKHCQYSVFKRTCDKTKETLGQQYATRYQADNVSFIYHANTVARIRLLSQYPTVTMLQLVG